MHCLACGEPAAADDARFCDRCGRSLRVACPSCGISCPLDFRFCDRCGRALGQQCIRCAEHCRPGARYCGACGAILSSQGSEAGARTESASVHAAEPAPPSAVGRLTGHYVPLASRPALLRRWQTFARKSRTAE
ncbi:MAG: zinc ribbon domain-containing protein [Chloroflexota bacterium]|nr:zinc ribbon domain-containing protein [Chloroflexota bacterium]